MSLLQLPLSKFKSLNLTTPFLNGSSPLLLNKPSPSPRPLRLSPSPLTIQAIKYMQGKVINNTNDKTVNVQVVRLAPHPKYKRRIRHLKKYQAHDPDNQFKVGDLVRLQKCRPISKTKTFLALPVPPRNSTPKVKKVIEEEGEENKGEGVAPQELQLPLESEQA